MKKYLIPFIVLGLYACDSEDPTDLTLSFTNEESAEHVASTISGNVVSYASDLGTIGVLSESSTSGRVDSGLSCGETKEVTASNSIDSLNFSFQYQATYDASLTCVRNIPISLSTNINSSSHLDSRRLNASYASIGNATLNLDDENIGNFLLNASLENNGTVTQKLNRQLVVNTNSKINLVDLSINPAYISELINQTRPTSSLFSSGSGSYEATISDNAGGEFTFTATFEITAEGTLEITINGESFTADLLSGELM
ncbi:MAG: hypothetical protein HRT61_10130 [Ekhidna sp.]|nr:hypothetical protein [Ekhidna sp.]